jgi:ribosome biogenesis protein ERB1
VRKKLMFIDPKHVATLLLSCPYKQLRMPVPLLLPISHRVRKKRMFIDPKTLVPKLPKPQDLQPFPQTLAMRFSGHTSRVRCISPHPSGQWLASGSDDGTVRLWEVATGRCSAKWKLGEAVMSVGWCPNPSLQLLGAAVGKRVVLLLSGLGGEDVEAAARAACKVGGAIFGVWLCWLLIVGLLL